MEHFYQNIQGWSDGIDLVYQSIVAGLPRAQLSFMSGQLAPLPASTRSYHFVEVGTWRGRSAAFMAVEIANSTMAHRIRFDCVDTWQGSTDEPEHQQDPSVVNDTLYEEFLANMLPVQGYYQALRMASTAAAKTYPDQSLDLVFIDAQHTYEAVREDILAWWPKVRVGGIIAGHDYNHEGDHGVGKAVRELLPLRHQTPPWCWLVQKQAELIEHQPLC
jgi:hypothetical protein